MMIKPFPYKTLHHVQKLRLTKTRLVKKSVFYCTHVVLKANFLGVPYRALIRILSTYVIPTNTLIKIYITFIVSNFRLRVSVIYGSYKTETCR
jgi:hypothetical protein